MEFISISFKSCIKIDSLGLILHFGTLFGKWSGSAVNAASESKISHHEAAIAIDAANGPIFLHQALFHLMLVGH
jgi:hypothetical protein